jgi:hypothetical protein
MARSTLVLLGIFILSVSASAQEMSKFSGYTEEGNRYTSESFDFNSQRLTVLTSDTIIYEDFSSGGPGNLDLPNGWTTMDMNTTGTPVLWQWTNSGTTGQYGSSPFQSFSSGNGWLLLDSDSYGSEAYDSYLYSPPFDCSNHDAVGIAFEEFYRRWGNEASNPYNGNPTYLGISADSGQTWTEIELHSSFIIGQMTDNPEERIFNISGIAANQPSVRVYFRMKGLWDYWWHIDDLLLFELPDNDLQLCSFAVSSVQIDTAGFAVDFGHYTQMPLIQSTPLRFEALLTNSGAFQQTNIKTIFKLMLDGTLFHSDSISTPNLNSEDTLEVLSGIFIPTLTGVYQASVEVIQSEPDEYPANNSLTINEWEITDNKIFARDFSYNDSLTQAMNDLGDFVGNAFFVPNNDTIQSISVFVDYRTTPGTFLKGMVYRIDSVEPIPHSGTLNTEIREDNIGSWLTIPVFNIDPTDCLLPGNRNYIVGFEKDLPDPNMDLLIGFSEKYNSNSTYVSHLTVDGDWYRMDNIPMVRMNLAGTIEPPVFAHNIGSNYRPAFEHIWIPSSHPVTFALEFKINDPNGLPLDLTLPLAPYFVSSFIASTDGQYSLGLELDPNIVEINKPYSYEVHCDNGSSKNQLIFKSEIEIYCNDHPWSINEQRYEDSSIRIFPNPSCGKLQIDGIINSNVEIYNLMGRRVGFFQSVSSGEVLDLQTMKAGTYLMKITFGASYLIRKIIVIK